MRFELAGVPALLLKGRSLARWLYPRSAERSYRDCDLLVPPGGLETAAAARGDRIRVRV